jgi:branched-chain amino acid transport system permease protein
MVAAAMMNQIIQGILLGGLYAMFAIGLSLSVGVMRFVNIAHGDLIVLVSFLLLTLTSRLGMSVIVATAIVVPITFAGGYLLQRLLLQRVLNRNNNVLAIVLVTFGLSVIIQYSLQGIYGADTRLLSGGGIQTATIMIGSGINIGVLPLTIFIAAVALVSVLDLLLYASAPFPTTRPAPTSSVFPPRASMPSPWASSASPSPFVRRSCRCGRISTRLPVRAAC